MKIIPIKPEETYPLRLAVLKTCEAYEYKYIGDFDVDTIHLAGIQKNEITGVVTLMKSANKQFSSNQLQIRGMAIAKKWQGNKVGEKLITHIRLLDKKSITIWCNAREKAVQFYQKQGFKIKGSSFNIKNVGIHYVMYLEI